MVGSWQTLLSPTFHEPSADFSPTKMILKKHVLWEDDVRELLHGCFSYTFLGKLWPSWCQICAHLAFFFKIVPVAGAKRGRLEVDVYIYICVEDVSWCGVEGWCGTVWISEEVGTRLVKEKKIDHSSRLCRSFWGLISGVFFNRKDRTLPALASATANQSATTGDADHDKHGEPTQINETRRNPRWTTPKPKKQNAKRENTPLSLALSRPERLIYIYSAAAPFGFKQCAKEAAPRKTCPPKRKDRKRKQQPKKRTTPSPETHKNDKKNYSKMLPQKTKRNCKASYAKQPQDPTTCLRGNVSPQSTGRIIIITTTTSLIIIIILIPYHTHYHCHCHTICQATSPLRRSAPSVAPRGIEAGSPPRRCARWRRSWCRRTWGSPNHGKMLGSSWNM